VAVGHGRDAAEVARWFNPARRVGATFVSAMGGSPLVSSPTNPNEIARRLADRCGGRSVELFAPAFVESEPMRDALLRQQAVAETLDRAAKACTALVGVGGTDDDCTMVRSGCFSVDEIRRLRATGAVGDVLGHYVDATGERLESPETQRLVSLGLDQLHAIDTVVVVVSEAEKPRAILGVLRTGVADVLVVDEGNARFLAEAAQADPLRPGSEV
jgi:DNA-binding transcriptional regulator LsrR (DeoR family)